MFDDLNEDQYMDIDKYMNEIQSIYDDQFNNENDYDDFEIMIDNLFKEINSSEEDIPLNYEDSEYIDNDPICLDDSDVIDVDVDVDMNNTDNIDNIDDNCKKCDFLKPPKRSNINHGLTTKMSVFYCCHYRLYINKVINDVMLIDNNIIPSEIRHYVFPNMSKSMIKDLDNYLYNDKVENGLESLANKIIKFTTNLKVAFKYQIENKCYCRNKIPWDNEYGKYITAYDQYNLFVYMFNKDSKLPPMYDPVIYNSYYRNLVDSALKIMWKFGNK
jgi:hypothetical protein